MTRMVANRWLRPVLALAAAAASGAGCGGGSSQVPPPPDGGMPDPPVMGAMGSVRFLNAAPLAGSVDLYLHGQT